MKFSPCLVPGNEQEARERFCEPEMEARVGGICPDGCASEKAQSSDTVFSFLDECRIDLLVCTFERGVDGKTSLFLGIRTIKPPLLVLKLVLLFDSERYK